MCGISGFNFKDEQKIRGMVSCTSYRGPDADGVYVDDKVSLGHNRLAVIDLSPEANQPMFDVGGDLVIVFNGEIYNFKELKEELKDHYNFKTQSDTEVILAGYRTWGTKVFEKLNGMYGLAIWDKKEGKLICARDHMGMKPLYYWWDGKRFIFASEMSAILTHDVERRLNIEAFNHYMRVLYAPEPMTLIQNIYKLPPAHYLVLKNDLLTIDSYEKKDIEPTTLSYDEATYTLKEKVLKAVERHLVADVPVGVYLSGGIDSSTVLYAMSTMKTNIETFSIGFSMADKAEEPKFNADFDLARRTAKYFGATHNPITISTADAANAFEKTVAHNIDPISNPTAIAMYLLAKHAREKVTVALTGNAGDELFGGYERYQKALLGRFAYGRKDLYAKFMFIKDDRLTQVVEKKFFTPSGQVKPYYMKYLQGRDAVEALMNTDQRSWLPDYFFMLSDKMSMASALEERMPLADKELVEFARSLPRKYKVDLKETKKVLKDAFRNDLPKYLFSEPKRGWFSPAAKWLREPEFKKLAKELLNESYYSGSTSTLFDWRAVEGMLDRHIDKTEYNLTLIWAIMTFQAWSKANSVVL
jgi:asparagine synthase (glutamine-hydrolysing)